jgi:hypothetical protein
MSMDWQTIAAVAAAITAILGAIAAVTGHVTKAWTAGRRWQLRRKKVPAAGEATPSPAPSTGQPSGPSLRVDQALQKGPGVVWIIYRREDTAGTAQRLHEELSGRLGPENVRLDPEPDEAPPGGAESFHEQALRSVIALVLIGPGWLRSEDEYARRRLSVPDDPVRRQIAAALSVKVPLLPILVRGAEMPMENQLPQEISGLALRNALIVTQTSWEDDVARVARVVEHLNEARSRSGRESLSGL